MGVLARAVLERRRAGSPESSRRALLDLGVGETRVSELIVTDGLRERKAIMDARGDAFVALPGGLGTFEEILEVMTLKQLGYHAKAIAVLDLDGYYEPLWAQIQRGHRRGVHQGGVPRPLVPGARRRRAAALPRGLRAARLRAEVDAPGAAVTRGARERREARGTIRAQEG